MAESCKPPAPQTLVEGRFRLESDDAMASSHASAAFDERTQRKVVVACEEKVPARHLEKLGSVSHPHLVPVVEVIERESDWLVISRPADGERLSTRVGQKGPLHAVDAIRMTLRLVEALEKLHADGISHGRVHPDNLIVGLEPSADPSLLFGSLCPNHYVRPERLDPAEPLSPRDDCWATTALLYYMLTGDEAPAEGLESATALDARDITDPLLLEVLFHGLARNPEQRQNTLFAQKRELTRWFIAHAADEPTNMAVRSEGPPPLPPSMPPSLRNAGAHPSSPGASIRSQRSVVPTKPVLLRSVPLAVLAGALGLATAWGLAALRKKEPTVVVKDRVVPAQASAGPVDLAEIPVTGKEQEAQDATTSCVKGYLREGTLQKGASLDNICHTEELPRALGELRLAFASTTGTGAVSLPRFDTLGWYSLPALSGLRQACCGESRSSIRYPDLKDLCPDFEPALLALGKSLGTNQPLDAAMARYAEAAQCATKTGRATGISAAPPSPISAKAFRDLFAPALPTAEGAPSSSAQPARTTP